MVLSNLKAKDLNLRAKKAIYEYIQEMDIKETTKLPREEVLAKQLGVSRITVRNALGQLAAEGIILRQQGRGTFVNVEALRMKANFSPIEDFREIIKNSGYTVDVKIDNIIVRSATDIESEQLDLAKDAEIISVEKMFYADKIPAVYCVDRIPLDIYKGKISKSEMLQPLFDMVHSNMERKVSWDKVELLTTTNIETPMLDKYFNCQNVKSFLNCNVLNYDENNDPIIYSNEYIDTDYIQFSLLRKKSIY